MTVLVHLQKSGLRFLRGGRAATAKSRLRTSRLQELIVVLSEADYLWKILYILEEQSPVG